MLCAILLSIKTMMHQTGTLGMFIYFRMVYKTPYSFMISDRFGE